MQEYYIIAGENLKAVIEQTNINFPETLQPRNEFRYFYHSEYKIPSVIEIYILLTF